MVTGNLNRPGSPSPLPARPDDAFVRAYQGLVSKIARQTIAQLNLPVDQEDLIAFGMTGLMEAHTRYRPECGVLFRTFAYYRIRGAVLDGTRQMSPLPRRAYARLKAALVADQEAEASCGVRIESAKTLAEGSKGESAASSLDGVLGRVAAAYCAAGSLSAEEGEEDTGAPDAVLLRSERSRHVRQAIDELPKRERHLIFGHYIRDKPLDMLAEELGLSKSWCSRLHARGLDLLRELLSDDTNSCDTES